MTVGMHGLRRCDGHHEFAGFCGNELLRTTLEVGRLSPPEIFICFRI